MFITQWKYTHLLKEKQLSQDHSIGEFLLRLHMLRTWHSIREDVGSILGFAQWVKVPALSQAAAWVTGVAQTRCCHGKRLQEGQWQEASRRTNPGVSFALGSWGRIWAFREVAPCLAPSRQHPELPQQFLLGTLPSQVSTCKTCASFRAEPNYPFCEGVLAA